MKQYKDLKDTVEITVEQLLLFDKLADDALNAVTEYQIPEQLMWVKEDGTEVKKPTKTVIEKGEVKLITDFDNTFSKDNVKRIFTDKLTDAMLVAKKTLAEIHQQNEINGLITEVEQ